MAISMIGVANTPCSISRNISRASGDSTSLRMRVGLEGTPLPSGWVDGGGNADNPVFFRKLVVAAMRLTGFATEAELSAEEIPASYLLVQAPNAALLSGLQSLFPNGALLDAPLIEAFGTPFSTQNGGIQPNMFAIEFEDTGGSSAPTYCDLVVSSPDVTANYFFECKLFHSLTM